MIKNSHKFKSFQFGSGKGGGDRQSTLKEKILDQSFPGHANFQALLQMAKDLSADKHDQDRRSKAISVSSKLFSEPSS